MNALDIRNELLYSIDNDVKVRRKIIALAAAGLVDFSIISLYQTGVIKKLPDLPHPIFASNKVNAAEDAYMMGVPDGPVSATVYAASMVLAAAGGGRNASRKPVMDTLLGATVAGNAIGAIYYLWNMTFKQKKICVYCVTGAVINITSAVLVAPLFVRSAKKMFKK